MCSAEVNNAHVGDLTTLRVREEGNVDREGEEGMDDGLHLGNRMCSSFKGSKYIFWEEKIALFRDLPHPSPPSPYTLLSLV